MKLGERALTVIIVIFLKTQISKSILKHIKKVSVLITTSSPREISVHF